MKIVKRLACFLGIHSWAVYEWHPHSEYVMLVCMDCKRRESINGSNA